MRNDIENWFSNAMWARASTRAFAGNEELAEITVVVPSYGRQEFILRQFVYWAASSAELLVIDGSPVPISEKHLLVLSSFPRIRYIHIPIPLSDRLRIAAQLIATQYAIMLADDEFHLFHGLHAALTCLKKGKEAGRNVVGCIGQSLRFKFDASASSMTIGEGYPHQNYHVTDKKIEDRLRFAMADYSAATAYALLTSLCWRETWGSVDSWSSPYATELQQAFATYISGEFVSTDEIYWMRSEEQSPVDIEGEFERRLSFLNWWQGRIYRVEKKKFVKVLAEKIVDKDGSTFDVAIKKINDAVQAYMDGANQLMEGEPNFRSRVRTAISRFIRGNLSNSQIRRIQKLLFGERSFEVGDPFEYCILSEYLEMVDNNSLPSKQILKEELSQLQEQLREFYMYR